MVFVNVVGKGTIQIESSLYQGDIHSFIKEIIKKVLPKLSDKVYERDHKGKYILRRRDGTELNPGIEERKLKESRIREILSDKDATLTLSRAPMPSKGEGEVFIQGKLKMTSSDLELPRPHHDRKDEEVAEALRNVWKLEREVAKAEDAVAKLRKRKAEAQRHEKAAEEMLFAAVKADDVPATRDDPRADAQDRTPSPSTPSSEGTVPKRLRDIGTKRHKEEKELLETLLKTPVREASSAVRTRRTGGVIGGRRRRRTRRRKSRKYKKSEKRRRTTKRR